MDTFALCIQALAVLLTLAGMAYGVIALWAAKDFDRATRAPATLADTPPLPVTILKPVRGVDPRMYPGLLSHCRQTYAGAYELIFGVSSLGDPAVAEIARLRVENPGIAIRVIECPERLGSNGKVSNLAQMLPHARYEHVVVNDSDILVSPQYLTHVMAAFADPDTGLVTVPYRGRAESGIWSKIEALGISTDFLPGVLTARRLEHGIRFGLGSTLATTKTALEGIGGFAALVNQLADDYELGARLSAAGYRVALVREIVDTTVPAYTLRGLCEHQLRWARSTRDSRRAGYLGLGVTYVLPWALLAVVASGGALWSISLLSLALLVRVSVALSVGVGILRDEQVLRDLWLLPLRDAFGLFFWAWSYASDEVVWRGERFRLKRGQLSKA
jgi:ceramide glucosyltransferase